MSYLVLARKWRPQTFADVVGQRHVSLTLRNALKSDRLSHAYLFAGPRGVGKTSLARILAKALNCERQPALEPCNECAACRAITEGHCLDVLEIDGASNRGIDDVRQLRDSVKYAPSSVRAKVYIIDEVHMLTTDAFNALLKTLEEPPRHVYFILATTEPLKVPPTILSRCQRYDFGRLTVADLSGHLRRIVDAESLAIDDEALALLARKADGSVRDSLTLLDQVAATGAGPFTANDVQALLGLAGSSLSFEISEAVIAGDGARALGALQRAHREGANLQELADELVHHFRNLMLLALDPRAAEVIDATREEREQLAAQAAQLRAGDALRYLRWMLDAAAAQRRSAHGRVHLELALAEMAALPRAVDLAALLARLRGAPGERAEGAAGGSGAPGAAAGAGAGTGTGPASGGAGRSAAPQRRVTGAGDAGAARGFSRAHATDGAAEVGESEAAEGGFGEGVRAPEAVPLGTPQADRLLSQWALLLDRLRKERAFLGSCLHASRPLSIEAGRLRIALEDVNGFKSEQIEKPANRKLILRLIQEAYEEPLGLQIVRGAPASPQVAPGPAPDAVRERPPETAEPAANPGTGAPSVPRAAGPARGSGTPQGSSAPHGQPVSDGAGCTGGPRARGGPGAAAGREAEGARPTEEEGRARVRAIADLLDGDIIGPAR